jgi:alkylhydroperoxidase/carboxymuconolactone decarboxylase family protein YurZ
MTNPLDVFRQEAPVVADAFDNLVKAIVANEGLDEKTKQLILYSFESCRR